MFFRDTLAYWTLGPSVRQGGFFFSLILPTVCLSIVWLLDVYLRVRKWSGTSVGVNFFRLVLNIALNVYFLAALDWGVTGVLTGNLIAGAVATSILISHFLKKPGILLLSLSPRGKTFEVFWPLGFDSVVITHYASIRSVFPPFFCRSRSGWNILIGTYDWPRCVYAVFFAF